MLFTIFLSAMLEDDFRDIWKDKTTTILVRELLFADDNALISNSAVEIQRNVDVFANASSKLSLKNNIQRQK